MRNFPHLPFSSLKLYSCARVYCYILVFVLNECDVIAFVTIHTGVADLGRWPWSDTTWPHSSVLTTHITVLHDRWRRYQGTEETRQLWHHDGPSCVYGGSSPLDIFIRVHDSDCPYSRTATSCTLAVTYWSTEWTRQAHAMGTCMANSDPALKKRLRGRRWEGRCSYV